MAGNVKFKVSVTVRNAQLLPELQGRLKDLSPAFEAVIPEWARLNEDKFDDARGKESSGAAVDDLVFWQPLRPSTMKSKRRRGRPDNIMVDSGDLKRAMTSPDLLFQRVSPQDAVFGTPLNMEEADKVRWQWTKRQAVFLSTVDQNTIRRIVRDYLNMGENFEEIRFAQGVAAVQQRAEMAQMDADFSNDVQSEGT